MIYTFLKQTKLILATGLIMQNFFVADLALAERSQSLTGQVKSLAEQHHFKVKGLSKLEEQNGLPVTGELEEQLDQLLIEYNHILIRGDNSKLEKLIIIDKKLDRDHAGLQVPIFVKNGQFLVNVSIKGNDNQWLDHEMVIDTGANLVVLPESSIDLLNMSVDDMETSQLQTVNGKVVAYMSQLPGIAVGDETAEQVPVAFVKDDLMGTSGLLGMSFLGLFRFSIDDELDTLTLKKK